ncbi:hypothetical protein GLU26_01925 [Nanohaloarchaea archaeon]|nr:hypothetical protein [Candidatus Nanohaloarchaea archaeon]
MIGLILLFLLLVPFIDLYLLVEISNIIGFWEVIAIILITGMVGAEVMRREGAYVLRKAQRSVTAGEITRNVLEGVLLVGGGILLLLPGVISDITGLSIIVRPVRERMAAKLATKGSSKSRIEFIG